MSETESFYPPKPKLVKSHKNSKWHASIIMLLFLAGFFLLISSNHWSLFLIFLFVLLLHELGHFGMMKLFNYKDDRMFTVPLLADWVKGSQIKLSQTQKLLVVLAGPLPGVIIGMICFFLAQQWQHEMLMWISIIFVSINVFNCLPVDPLDGGKILNTLFTNSQSTLKVVFAFLSSLVFIVVGYLLNSWIMIIFGFLLGFRVRMLQKIRSIHGELDEKDINYEKTYRYLTNEDYWQIRDTFIMHTPGLKDVIPGYRQVWDNEQLIANQINQLLLAPVKKNLSLGGKITFVLIWLGCVAIPILVFLWSDLNWFFDGN